MPRNQRFVLLGLAAVVIVVAAIVAVSGGSSGDSSPTKSSGPVTIVVSNAQPVGGVRDVTFRKGGTVDLKITSDTADEIHIHGYDVHKDVTKGGSVHFTCPAAIDGKFVVELEKHKQALANVTVEP
jgi:hypothetical protein